MTDDLRTQLQATLGDTYQLDRELGGGGMSRVFLSTETALDRKVVLKVLPPDLASSVSVDRFKREISLAARLQHAHIVPLLATGDANGLPWFAMPFVDGESLRARLGHGELPIAEVVRTLRDVASALAYAHGKGVVHRDIKPENILIAEGSAVVTDFGVAKALSDAGAEHGGTLTSVGMALGTPAYMAPEQIAADPRTDQRADLYALGVVAYEMLTGHNPFGGRSPQATLAAHMTEEPTLVERVRPSTPAALAQLIRRCMAKSAADRPQTAQEIVHALDALATPTGTMPLLAGSGVAYPSTRKPTARNVAMVAGVIVLLGGVWFFSKRASASTLNPKRVAVAPCENLTGDTTFAQVGRIAADYLTQQISQTDSVDVVSGTTVNMIVGDGKTAQGDVVQRIAATTHAGAVITCTVSRRGDSLRVEARIIDARTGSIKRALDPGVGPVSDPLAAISALRERVLGSLVSGDLARRVTFTGRPPKYSAYRAFMDGVERFGRYQDYRGARPLFEKAIALDSTFTPAYASLAFSSTNLGEWDAAERTISILAQRRDQLSSYDRLALDGLEALLRGDNAAQVRAVRGQVERDSSFVAEYLLGLHSINMLRAADALAALKASDSMQTAGGWVPQVTVMATAYHLLGDYRGELARVELGRKQMPTSRPIVIRELNALAGLHEAARALALADTLLRGAADPNETQSLNGVLAGYQEFGAHGDSTAARQLARLALDWVRAHPASTPTSARLGAEARTWLANAQLDSARARFMAVRDTADIAVGGWLGIIAVRTGDRERATTIADSIGSLNRKWSRGGEQYWRGAILAALGRKDEAVALLTQAAAKGQSMSAWHHVAPLAPLRGYASFEALIAPKR